MEEEPKSVPIIYSDIVSNIVGLTSSVVTMLILSSQPFPTFDP